MNWSPNVVALLCDLRRGNSASPHPDIVHIANHAHVGPADRPIPDAPPRWAESRVLDAAEGRAPILLAVHVEDGVGGLLAPLFPSHVTPHCHFGPTTISIVADQFEF